MRFKEGVPIGATYGEVMTERGTPTERLAAFSDGVNWWSEETRGMLHRMVMRLGE
jgi:hypothetical protein